MGGGCYIGGRLNRGRHFFANAIGHIAIEPGGLPCTCGLSGCLEAYTNARALLRYAAKGNFASGEEVIAAANAGDATARDAILTLTHYLAIGCASIVHLLDPEFADPCRRSGAKQSSAVERAGGGFGPTGYGVVGAQTAHCHFLARVLGRGPRRRRCRRSRTGKRCRCERRWFIDLIWTCVPGPVFLTHAAGNVAKSRESGGGS